MGFWWLERITNRHGTSLISTSPHSTSDLFKSSITVESINPSVSLPPTKIWHILDRGLGFPFLMTQRPLDKFPTRGWRSAAQRSAALSQTPLTSQILSDSYIYSPVSTLHAFSFHPNYHPHLLHTIKRYKSYISSSAHSWSTSSTQNHNSQVYAHNSTSRLSLWHFLQQDVRDKFPGPETRGRMASRSEQR